MKTLSLETQTLVNASLTTSRLLSKDALYVKTKRLLGNLNSLANFAEARDILVYLPFLGDFAYENIIRSLFSAHKTLHFIESENGSAFKVYQTKSYADLKPETVFNLPQPNPNTCKQVHLSAIDIVIVNGVAFDEKGNRMGNGPELYDRLMVKLSPTVRKVAIAFESQLLPAIPAEARNKPVDIIVTDKRTIYKI